MTEEVGWKGREEGVCITVADLHGCMAETNITL